MSEKNKKHLVLRIPSGLDVTTLVELIDRKLGEAIKSRHDDIVLDLGTAAGLDRPHLNVLTRWIRNLKSLGGSLTLTGVDEEKKEMLHNARLTGLCKTYLHLEDFLADKSGDEIVYEEEVFPEAELGGADGEEEAPREGASLGELAAEVDVSGKLDFLNPEAVTRTFRAQARTPASAPPPTEAPEASPDTEPGAAAETTEAHGQDAFYNLMGEDASATDGVAGEILQDMDKVDVEEDLFREQDVLGVDAGPAAQPDSTHPAPGGNPPPSAGETVAAPFADSAPAEETSASGSEFFYTLTGDSAENSGGVDEKMLEGLDQVSVEDGLFEEEAFADETASPAAAGEAPAPTGQGERRLAARVPAENNSAEGGLEDVSIKSMRARVEKSGEYECLGCGASEYFLKGCRFHACAAGGCAQPDEGWHLVYMLF